MGRKGRMWSIAVAVCIIVMICSVIGIGRTLWVSNRENKTFDDLIQMAEEEPVEETAAPTKAGADTSGAQEETKAVRPQRNYKKLKEENQDFAAWMRIEDTKIDYPVMHTPEDIQYYIHRDFYGNKTGSGTPFIGDFCDVNSDSMIIYGHNMKNGTMFGELDLYESKKYRDEHPIMELNTLDESREYEIFAAFHTRLAHDAFPYYNYVGDLTEDNFSEFMEQLGAVAYYGSGNWPKYGDQLVMLSTCSYHTTDGRFVVVGKRVDEGNEVRKAEKIQDSLQ